MVEIIARLRLLVRDLFDLEVTRVEARRLLLLRKCAPRDKVLQVQPCSESQEQ